MQPDNDLAKFEISIFLPDTFFLTYSQKIDRDLLAKRFAKKSRIQGKHIELINSFETRVVILAPKESSLTVSELKSKFANKFLNNKFEFICQTIADQYLLVQIADKTCNFSSLVAKCGNSNEFLIEYCPNLDLLSNLQIKSSVVASAKVSGIVKKAATPPSVSKTGPKIETIKSALEREDFKRLIKSETTAQIVLNESEPFVSNGLAKIKNMRLQLSADMRKFKANIELDTNGCIVVSLADSGQRDKILEHLCASNFNFVQMSVSIGESILRSCELFAELGQHIENVRTKFIDVSLEIDKAKNRVTVSGMLRPVERCFIIC